MRIFLTFLISATVLILEHFLSESKYKLLGGIIPLFVILFALWCIFLRTPKLEFGVIIAFAIIFILLLCDWADGRKRFKKKKKEEQESEIKKMKAQDLDD